MKKTTCLTAICQKLNLLLLNFVARTIMVLIFPILIFGFSMESHGQYLVPSSGSNTYNPVSCGTNIYDNNGASNNYSDDCNGYIVLYAPTGKYISISGTIDTEGGYDYLYIYEGAGTSGTLIWRGSGQQDVIANGSTLTIRFDSDGNTTESGLDLVVNCYEAYDFPFNETFEDASSSRKHWGHSYDDTHYHNWFFTNGDDNNLNAHGGSKNAAFEGTSADYPESKLISPIIDISTNTCNPKLSFWYAQDEWMDYDPFEDDFPSFYFNELEVYCRTSPSGSWTEIWSNNSSAVSDWTNVTLDLSSYSSTTFQIAFHGWDYNGYNLVVDDVSITGSSSSTEPTSITNNSTCSSPITLTSNGGSLGTDAIDVWYEGGCANEAFTQEWANQPYSTGNTTVNSTSNGLLNVTSTNNDPMIFMNNLGSFDPNAYRYINVRYKVTSGTAGKMQFFWYNSLYTGANGNQYRQQSIISDNNWHILNIDMATANGPGDWFHSNVTGWRFDWATANGVTMDIDFITLSDRPIIGTGESIDVSPSTSTSYYTAKKGSCNTTSCVSKTITPYSVPAPPIVSNNGPTCSGETANLQASGMAPGIKTAYFNASSKTNSASYSSTTNNFTMEMWVKPTETIVLTPEANSGVSANLGTYDQNFAVYPGHGGAANGGAGISVGTNGVAVYEHGSGYLPSLLIWQGNLNDWTHIAVVYDNKTPNLYINGNHVKTGLTSLRSNVFPTAGVGTGYGNYVGYIDNYRIWNDDRTQSEIINNMHLENPANITGLIAHYKFDNNTDASVGTNLTNTAGTFTNQDFYTYTWTGTSAPGASQNETQITGNLTSGTHNYTVETSFGGCNSETSANTSVLVHQPFNPGAINTTDETICSGGDPAAIGSTTPASGGDGTITYKWQANGSDIASSNSATYNPPAGLTSNTTYTRWAHDGTCNTSWEQSTNSWTVTVETPPAPAGLDAGDYYWAGEISNSWNNANNWLLYDGSNYSVPASIPNATSDVFIKSYASTCGTTNALTDASSTVHAKDVNIETVLTIGNSAQLNITGDFNNTGTFNAGTGSIVLNGTSQQSIQPGGDDFYNLTINNTSGLFDAIVLDDNINIAGHLQLSQGIIDGTIAPYKVKLLNGATANSGNANSFVNGEVERTGTTAFVYPIGDVANIDGTDRGIWAPIETDACASSTISANYYYENPPYDWWYHGGNMDATIDHVSDREYWDLVTDNATPAVTIYWTDNTDDLHSFGSTSGEMTSTFVADNLTIAHYNTALGKWDDMGASIPAIPIYFDDGSIKTTSAFSSYSPITFASKNPDFTLPVELINFSTNCMDEYVEINWTSATEINNEYYLIERSKDGISWEAIAKVPGAGNSNTTIDYQVIDEKFNSGINYYRLTQFDFDGSSETFEIRTVNCDNDKMEPEITIYPNPFTNELNLMALNLKARGKAVISITDMAGRIIQTYNVQIENNSFHLLMHLDDLVSGMYILKIQTKDEFNYYKVEKK